MTHFCNDFISWVSHSYPKEEFLFPPLADKESDRGIERFLDQGHAASKRQNWEWSPDWFNAKAQTFFQKSLLSPGLRFLLLVSLRKSPGKSVMLSKDLLVLLPLRWDAEAPLESFLHLGFLGHSINLWKHCWLRAWALLCVCVCVVGEWISSTYTVRLYWKG